MNGFAWGIVATVGISVLAPVRARAQGGFDRTPPGTAPASTGDHPDPKVGVTLGLALGGGRSFAMAGLEAGYLITPNLAIIATATGLVVPDNDDEGGVDVFFNAGARWWLHRVFFDAQIGVPRRGTTCDLGGGCHTGLDALGMVGVGWEFVKGPSGGVDVHVSSLLASDGHQLAHLTMAGLGFHAYF